MLYILQQGKKKVRKGKSTMKERNMKNIPINKLMHRICYYASNYF